MSTSKTFTYSVTVVAYRDPKYTGGVAELYVGGRYVDWINLFEFDADKSTREALEKNGGDLVKMLEFDAFCEVSDVLPGCEEAFFEWAVSELAQGGATLSAGLHFGYVLRGRFGDKVSHTLNKGAHEVDRFENGTRFLRFTLESTEPLELPYAKIRPAHTYPRPA